MPESPRQAADPHSQAEVQLQPPQRRDEWARTLGVTTDALEAAVQAVGPRVDRVKDYLTGGNAGRQSGG